MFNEKRTENYKGKELPVWQTPKYEQSKVKAMEIIKKYERITEADFWILMNTYANGTKMMYSGLIISHNGCLKINDEQPKEKKFVPSCVTLDKEGYNKSLVFSYVNDEQGIYEVGEVSASNCKNDYPYAMAYKRLFDRVVLKLCGLAYDGVYSDSEADEFKQKYDDTPEVSMKDKVTPLEAKTIEGLIEEKGRNKERFMEYFQVSDISELTKEQYVEAHDMLINAKQKGDN